MYADFRLGTDVAVANAIRIDSSSSLTYQRNNSWRYKGNNSPVIYFDALVKPQAGDLIVRIAHLEHIHIPMSAFVMVHGAVREGMMEA